jgi:hypothetical protein
MTPKEKAIELEKRYEDATIEASMVDTRLLALIAVEEIIKALPPFEYGLEFVAKIEFWNNVKKEIEAL